MLDSYLVVEVIFSQIRAADTTTVGAFQLGMQMIDSLINQSLVD